MTISRTKILLVTVLAFAVGTPAYATVFNINETIGSGSVSGTITTNGTLGTLGSSDITDWNLLLNSNGTTFSLLGPQSGNNSALQMVGSALSETATALNFNFSATDDAYAIFQNPQVGSSKNFFCLQAPNSGCTYFSPSGMAVATNNGANPDGVILQGELTIGTIGNVPEPGTLALLGLGLAGIAFTVSRRRKSRMSA